MALAAPSFAFVVLCIICCGVCCNGETQLVASPMERTELEALYSAIQGFVGQSWNGSDLYPDPCGWTPIQGVSCDLIDGYWYVTSFSIGPIHDNSLVCDSNAEFRPYLFSLKHLKSISFFNCFASIHRKPTQIPTDNWEVLADSLESLEFRSNPGLIGEIPTTLGVLRNLQSLVLLENGITGTLPTNIGNLINLRRLTLAGNRLKGRLPESLGRLNNLLILDFSRNILSGPLPLTFKGLTTLLKLDLSNNQLQGCLPIEIGNMKNLTLLDLSSNKFSGGLPQSLQEMSTLEELVLSNNAIGGELASLEWHNMKDLTILDLSNMSFTGGVPDSIAALKRLRFLGLCDNNLTGDLSSSLEALPSISALYLNDNNLTGELKFSALFYGKMGRRFGAWNNPNLCFPVGLIQSGHAPFGVKPCNQEVLSYGN